MPSTPGELALHPAFVLHEGKRQDAAELADLTPAPQAAMLRPGTDAAQVIQALLAGARDGQPVLLDRHTGLDVSAPEAGFRVGILTSGTTGAPKCTWHTVERLLARAGSPRSGQRWLLTYSPHSYAGLQVLLHAMASGAELVAGQGLDASGLVQLAARTQPQAISATPSFWRLFLMALPVEADWSLTDIVLGGEAVDQALLSRLQERWPKAQLRHIYASSEAGSVFCVKDGLAGFPAAWLTQGTSGVGLRIVDGMLHVRSPRAAAGVSPWHATGDLVDMRGERVHFMGRADGLLNIGGEKVDLEQVEARVLALPAVADARLYGRANPVTGFLVEAEVVTRDRAAAQLQLAELGAQLRAVERPRRIHYVDQLSLGATGKKQRRQ